jgi:D-alanyl-D-alanine carboxypeptidase
MAQTFRFFLFSAIHCGWLFFAAAVVHCQAGPEVGTPPPAAPADSGSPRAAAAPAENSDTMESTDYLLGKFEPAERADFVPVGKPYSDRPGMRLRRETMEAFVKMYEAAEKDGVRLRIISSTRTFDQQKVIWSGKWTRFAEEAPAPEARARKILEFSAMPGASRHHWGTDIDLNDLNNPAFGPGGAHEKVYRWLLEHAPAYGFCQPYTAGRPHGYHEERWHWSYLPLAQPLLTQYRQRIGDAQLTGFPGAETAAAIGILEHYVLGINPDCLER